MPTAAGMTLLLLRWMENMPLIKVAEHPLPSTLYTAHPDHLAVKPAV